MSEKHLGKYRATVINNIDPERRGRLLVEVTDAQGLIPSSWAMPCVPFAGIQSGMYVVPSIGSGVWIEFEQGDLEYPIWVGGYWGSASEVPSATQLAVPPLQNVVLQTPGQAMLMLSDTPGPTGGIMLKTASGAFISITDIGITLSNGKGAMISMVGPAVTVNQGALLVQ